MSIKSKLEEARRILNQARADACVHGTEHLMVKIRNARDATNEALALADPGEAWLEETEGAWRDFPKNARYILRFAAKIAAGELRKFRKGFNNSNALRVLVQQIADLDAIAKGGGE